MALFQASVIKKYLSNLNDQAVKTAYAVFNKYYGTNERIENIKSLKEENYQEGFLREIFVNVLGYTINPDLNYNLTTEFKNETDAKKADGAILNNGKALGVIELKDTKTKDFRIIEGQAFNYKNHHSTCKYVITSNFEKLRFYIDDATEFEEFNLFDLSFERFTLLYLCLSKGSILSGVPAKIKAESKQSEEDITKKLYKDYSSFKRKIFENLVKNNPNYDKLTLLKKSQKLLDRLLFIFFAEDRGLLQTNLIDKIIDDYHKLIELDAEKPLYERFKDYFRYIDEGHRNIPAYNGELFKRDDILENLIIDDEVLIDDAKRLSGYDFDTEIDVNILGHIFEHSLTEIEEMHAQVAGETFDKQKTKRKKEGVFYTPQYITKYIVDNTLGRLCEEKKRELGLLDLELVENLKTKLTKKEEALRDKFIEYREFLKGLKILDPACGSGAFLNQALDFLIKEHEANEESRKMVDTDKLGLTDIEKSVLENNLFGVDINEESVEIAKLSLWLRTAHPGRKLNDLSNNIKCGNSLIDDPQVAGDKAFNWHEEFPDIMKNGGFDVVIGNPPYSMSLSKTEKIYFREKYKNTSQYQLDLYLAFMELSVLLLGKNGFISLITPNAWLKNLMNSECRYFLLKNVKFELIAPNLSNVFPDASVDNLIFVGKRRTGKGNIKIIHFEQQQPKEKHTINQDRLLNNDNYIFNVEVNDKIYQIFEKIKKNSLKLEKLFDITRGINPYDKYTGQLAEVIKTKAYHADYKKDETFVPEIRGKHVSRYCYRWDGKHYISYGSWLAAPRNERFFKGERLVFREILGESFICTLVKDSIKIDRSLYIALPSKEKFEGLNIKYILALLCSKLFVFYFRHISNEFDQLFPKIRVAEFKALLVKKVSIEDQQPFIEKVDIMLDLSQKLITCKSNFLSSLKDRKGLEKVSNKLDSFHELDYAGFLKELKKQKITIPLSEDSEWREYFNENKSRITDLKREIDTTDKEIDKMVYELYGLTYEEIAIVEGK